MKEDNWIKDFFDTTQYQGKIDNWNEVEDTYEDPDDDEDGIAYKNRKKK